MKSNEHEFSNGPQSPEAEILWGENMIINKTPYHNPHEYLFLDQKRKLEVIKCIKK